MASRQGDAADATEGSSSGGSPPWTAADQAEWEGFFNEHYVRLLTAGVSWGGDQQDAEDAVSVAMLDLNQRWHAVNNKTAYARRVVINYVTHVQRGDRKKIMRLIAAGAFVAASHDDHGLSHSEDDQWVRGLLDQLPPEQRRVMESIYGGLSTTEIAELFGKSEDNVRQHLSKARDRLRKALVREGYKLPPRRTRAASGKEAIQ
jgi:RNA polymerase sigma factor (sigma-70 family)